VRSSLPSFPPSSSPCIRPAHASSFYPLSLFTKHGTDTSTFPLSLSHRQAERATAAAPPSDSEPEPEPEPESEDDEDGDAPVPTLDLPTGNGTGDHSSDDDDDDEERENKRLKKKGDEKEKAKTATKGKGKVKAGKDGEKPKLVKKKGKGGIQIPEEWLWEDTKRIFEKPDVTPADEVEVCSFFSFPSSFFLRSLWPRCLSTLYSTLKPSACFSCFSFGYAQC
jgi:hypothetical protein